MSKPVLVVMAAGMGSRYGGLKQIDPVSKDGRIIMDFSIFDAKKAGFDDVVFIIKEELLSIFEETIGVRAKKFMNVSYSFQALDKYTNGVIDSERTKPLGTGHAVLCAKDQIAGRPFAVINADDFYGYDAFELMYNFLSQPETSDKYEFNMIGYKIENTVTENGYVSRGVCQVDENDNLVELVETLRIEVLDDNSIASTEDEGKTYTDIPKGTAVSMNMFGFTKEYLDELDVHFAEFLKTELIENPMKAEFYVPKVVDKLIKTGKANVKVLKTSAVWYGVTYKEDKPVIEAAIAKMIADGTY